VVKGFNLQAANFAAPDGLKDFGLARSQAGPFLSASLIILISLLVTGTQNAIKGACGATHPTERRATGLGWALGVGRAGAILGRWSAPHSS